MGYIPPKLVSGCFGTIIFMGCVGLSFLQLMIGVGMLLLSSKYPDLYQPSIIVIKIAVPFWLISLALLELFSGQAFEDGGPRKKGMVSLYIITWWLKLTGNFRKDSNRKNNG